MRNIKREQYGIAAILFSALILRLWGIGFGLPFLLHQDEPIVVNHALSYGTGDLNPHFFIIPPLCSYVLFAFYAVYFVLGKAFGLFAGTDDFALSFFSDPSIFYLIARLVLGLLPGVMAVWLCYVLYKRLFGEKGALYAAVIVAVSFLCVINSHYAYVDNVMLVFVLMTYISLLILIENPSLKNYLITAVLFGLGVGTKYNAALLAASCYTAHVVAVNKHGLGRKKLFADRRLWAATLVVVAVFVMTNPFSILDWHTFSGTVRGGIRNNYMGWTHHVRYSMAQGIGWALLAAGAAGGLMLFVKEKQWKVFFLFSFPVLFYLHLVFRSQRFSRYGLPLMPFLAIGAAFFIFQVLLPKTKTVFQKSVVLAFSLIIVLPTTVKSVKAALLFSGGDTRIISTKWIEKNILPEAKIAVDHTSFRPQILQTEEQISQKRKVSGYQKGLRQQKQKKIEYLLRIARDSKTYNVYFMSYKADKSGQFLSTVPAISYDLDALNGEGIDYIVVNYNTPSRAKDAFIEHIETEADVVAEFSPYYDGKIRKRYDPIDTTYIPIGTREIFSRFLTGPSLVVYKMRSGK